MVVYPSDDLAGSIAKNRLEPMLLVSPELEKRYHRKESERLELQFDGMYLSLTGANSPANLASKPIRFLFLDEVDKYPGASRKESDPISLARERTKTFWNRKIFLTSTPTLRTGHIWKALENADEVRHFFVPCPHCGKMIELVWKQIKFPDNGLSHSERAAAAFYVCQECGGVITDIHKPGMLRGGQWRAVSSKSNPVRKVAYWLNTLYSPFVSFSEMAGAFLASKDDPDAFQNFTNSWFAEPWEETRLITSADLVLERQTGTPEFSVPEWTKLLTAGVDVQETCLYWTIRAWGDYSTSQNIAHGCAGSFAEVERIMNLQYIREGDGEQMVVALALVDSGDNTDTVYEFCTMNEDWAQPCKGASHPMDSRPYRVSWIDRADRRGSGVALVLIDTGKFKDAIAARMRRENGTGSWMVYQDCDRQYAEQVTAEHKVRVRTAGGRTVEKWVPKTEHADNHYLDCEVYAMCAAELRGVRRLHLEEAERPAKRDFSSRGEDRSGESGPGWLGRVESWLQ